MVCQGTSKVGLLSYLKLAVSCQNHFPHAYGSVDRVRRARNHYTPLGLSRQAFRNCDQSRSSPAAEAVGISCACSSAAVVGVVSGNQNRLVVGVLEGGRLVASAPAVQLRVDVLVRLGDLVLRAFGHSIGPSLWCRSFA